MKINGLFKKKKRNRRKALKITFVLDVSNANSNKLQKKEDIMWAKMTGVLKINLFILKLVDKYTQVRQWNKNIYSDLNQKFRIICTYDIHFSMHLMIPNLADPNMVIKSNKKSVSP